MSDGKGTGGGRPFEPPPWEKEQFEELARRRAAEAEGPVADEPPAPAGTQPSSEVEPVPADALPGPLGGGAAEGAGGGLDERMAEAMIVQLSGQEGSALAPVRKAGRAAAWVLIVIGAGVVVLGVTMTVRALGAPVAGLIGASAVASIGLLILGGAAWLWVRASRD